MNIVIECKLSLDSVSTRISRLFYFQKNKDMKTKIDVEKQQYEFVKNIQKKYDRRIDAIKRKNELIHNKPINIRPSI